MYNIFPTHGGVCSSDGFFADGVSAGLKADNAKDIAFIYSEVECDVASVLQRIKCMQHQLSILEIWVILKQILF